MTASRRIVLAALALVLGAGVATAQVYVPGAHLLSRLQARQQAAVAALGLSAQQQQAYQSLHQRETSFRMDARTDIAQLTARVKTDLANPNADLHATMQTVQGTVDRLIAGHRQVGAAKLAFYDQLDAQQQASVRAQLLERIERLERVRDALLDLAEAAQ